ncbi:MAG: T9SS type A sorting domain-containing protein [Tannerella sp.]|nr:T9SS type A sorting domain-containing protein [Tannerella sp.]
MNTGEWHTLPDGEKIWQLVIRAKDAIAMMLYYSEFYIPEGGKLFIYNTEKSHILGAYTNRTNPSGRRFATEFVVGDELTLEYVAAPSGEAPRIEIEGIGYGYNNLLIRNGKVELRAGACEVSINCEEGDAWQNQKKGVCRMVQRIASKEYLCSASLVNNTAQDLKPYILTAHHCSFGSNNLTASEEDMEQWMFYFHYEREGCNLSTASTGAKTMVGCRKIAVSDIRGGSDGLLLLLNEMIPQYYNVYYNGWDHSNNPAKSGASIHHPWGEYKVISTFLHPISHSTFESLDGIKSDQHAHWNTVFNATLNGHGITEKGSSGAPLFNEHKLIVGTLTGGNSSCLDPGGLNLYGKMSYHWNRYSFADSTRMDVWLDPLHSGVQMLAGRYHQGALPAPRDLSITYSDKRVQLTWKVPALGKPDAYYIYDNNLRIGKTENLFFESDISDYGSHNYSVSAVYDNGNESEFLNQSLYVPEYKTPANVAAAFTISGKVAVSWQSPVYEQTIYWGERSADVAISMDEDGYVKPFYFGQLWTKDDIRPLHRRTLTAIKFLPVRNNTYEIYIAQGDRVYRQKIANSSHSSYYETNTISLLKPFVINGNSQLIVALYVENPKNYPAYCDAGPAISGKGDIYSYDGVKWKSLYETDHDFNMNFFIAGIVTSAEGDLPTTYSAAPEPETVISSGTAKPKKIQTAAVIEKNDITLYSLPPIAFPEINGYNIYRNNVKITTASASVRRYVDPDDLEHTSYYQVSTLYSSHESDLSSKAEISPLSSSEPVTMETIALHPSVFENVVEVSGVANISKIEVYAVNGKQYLQLNSPDKIINTQSLPAGIYIFRIYTRDNACHTIRGVKRGR